MNLGSSSVNIKQKIVGKTYKVLSRMFAGEEKRLLSNVLEMIKTCYCLSASDLPKSKSLIKVGNLYLHIKDDIVYAKLNNLTTIAKGVNPFIGYFFNCSGYDENGNQLWEHDKYCVYSYEVIMEDVIDIEIPGIIQNITEN